MAMVPREASTIEFARSGDVNPLPKVKVYA
jgi:hypothetical protein